jgi:hypothetical protein
MLFERSNKVEFLKEESDSSEFISRMKEILEKSSGDLKDRIEREIKLASIGEFGENNIAFELRSSSIPIYVLRDIHLEYEDLSAQLDFVVVSRKVVFIIECKNLIGDIDIDSEGNFIRNYNINGRRIREGIYSPITQNQRHIEVLRRIKREGMGNALFRFAFDKFFDENYKSIVVLANPKTILNAKYAKKEIRENVIRADQLVRYIREVNEKSKAAAFSDKDMKKFAEGLLALHTPIKSDYAKKYEELVASTVTEPGDKVTALESDNSEIIIKLKEFRLLQSREENIKPYFIFNDKQMMDLVSKMPRTKEELQGVCGFGPVKSEKYGEVILNILNEYK